MRTAKGETVKRILFICDSLKMGGIQTSLVSLANALSERCEVDLFLYYPHGPLRERLGPRVRVLEPSWRTQALGMALRDALRSGSLHTALFRGFSAVWAKLFDNTLPLRIAFSHEPRLTGYDLAVAFHQEQKRQYVVSGFIRFIDMCVEAKLRAAWLHYDPTAIELDNAFNLPLYRHMDKIVLVSRSLKEKYDALYPDLQDKTDFCYNVINREELLAASAQPQAIPYPEGRVICFSACRLSEEKALVRGVRALAPVFRAHSEVMWFIAGDGKERESLQSAIQEAGLEEQVVLLGQQSNPYPYMRHADLLMNVSYHEAAPMVFMEAHVLGVPVFATRTSSADELLRDGETDFICENSEEGIRERFQHLMNQPQQLHEAKKRAEAAQHSYEDGTARLLSWMEHE